MTITGRTATLVENASATSVTATLPTDRQTGDLVVVVFALTCTAAQFTGPGGSWTQFAAPVDIEGIDTGAAYWQFSPASAPVASSSGSAGRVTAICQAFAGVDRSNPVDVAAATTDTTGTSVVSTGVTTVRANALMLSMIVVDTSARALVTPSGMTETKYYSATNVGRCAGIAQEVRATAGATGTRTWTVTPSPPTLGWAVFNTALRPALSSPPVANRPMRIWRVN